MLQFSVQRLSQLFGVLLLGLSLNANPVTQIDVTVQNWDSSIVGPILSPLTLSNANSIFAEFPATHLSVPYTSVAFNAYQPANSQVRIDIEFTGVAIATPNGNTPTDLLPGTYTNIARWPFVNPGQAGFSIDVGPFGVNEATGSFHILEADWNPAGTLASFAATFDVSDPTKPGPAPTFIGDVYYNYDLPAASAPEPATVLPLSILLVAGGIERLLADSRMDRDRSKRGSHHSA